MSVEWQKYTLDEVCVKITDGAHNSPKSALVGKPMASVKDLTSFGIDLSNARLIEINEFNKLVKQGCQPIVGDVVIAKDGNSALDTVCTIDYPIDAVLLSSVAILRPDQKLLDSRYLKYYFNCKTVLDYLKSNFISGAAIPRVVLRDFKKANINLPPLKTQKKIAHILGTLDEKIELNNKMNKSLETMTQAIFKSWFVDFDPVKAKIKAIKNKQDPELAAQKVIATVKPFLKQTPEKLRHIAGLFPSKLVNSELGLIPDGWGVKEAIDLIYLNRNSWTIRNHPEEVKYIDLANTKNGCILEIQSFVWQEAPSRAKRKVFLGDTIIGTVRPANRSFSHIFKSTEGLTASTGFAVLTPKLDLYRELIYFSSTLDSNFLRLKVLADGGAYPAVNPRVISDYLIPFDIKIIKNFHDISNYILKKVGINQSENDTLSILRDTLLPQLLSGELKAGLE
ncbi:MAG: type I restriction endonuclease subunit S [Candidatus Cloacimonadota bacterium]|nr:MAG: type I restriction endonuclease subunit S [Candidatus Cloacimonadota bacterium]